MRLLNSLVFIFISNFVFSQYFPSTNYTTADGLPNNAVRSLFIDSKNVLWIGTENGISRFVNGQFSNINEQDGLGHNSCWDISQDDYGNMWFASYGGGISKFDGKSFTVFTTKNGLPEDKVRKVFPYKNKLYVGTEQGISIIDIKTNKIVTPKIPSHKDDFICIQFFEYKGQIYFSTVFEGFFKIDESGKEPLVTPFYSHKNNYSFGHFGNVFFNANEGFVEKYTFDSFLDKKFTFKKFGKSIVWEFAGDKNNQLFGAANGVYNADGGLYQIENNEMIYVSDFYGIDSKILLNVKYDKSRDILYVGSNDKGLYEIRLDKMIDYDIFSNLSILDFESIKNHKFILYNKGISIIDKSKNTVDKISLQDFKNVELNYLKREGNSSITNYTESRDFELNFNIPVDDLVFYEMVKHESSIWVGSNIGIFEINAVGKITNYIPKHSLKIGFTYDDKFIETITYAGISIYDDIYKLKGKQYSKLDKITPKYIVKILNNKNKTYLLSVFNGLYVYHNGTFQSYFCDGIWKEKKLKHITINNKEQLILASEFGNVFVVDDSDKFKIVTTIPKNVITGNTINFLEAFKECILIGTEKGINIYQNGKIRFIDKEQGLKNCIINTSQIFDNQLWLGTDKGFYTIDLNKLLSEQSTVNLLEISSILINNEPILKSKYEWFKYKSKELVCDYKHNSFSINFVPNGQPFPNKLRFRYRLKKNNRWSPYNDKPTVFLSYLPYGNYNLEIEVLDRNAGKTTVFNLLNIIIKTPFWLTWWFISLMILFFIAIGIYIFLRSKTKAIESELIEKRIAETKLDALLSQMNPHFTFNAMNTIQDFIISNDIDKSLNFVSQLAKLMRLTLDNSNKKTISLEEEIIFLQKYIYIENTRFENCITVKFDISPEIDPYLVKVPTMIFQPFVENVFVHAFNSDHSNPMLDISFQLKEAHILECKINDNGKGLASFKKVKLHTSKALQLAEERLRLIQPQILNPIVIDFTDSDGTFVVILIQI